MKITILFLVFTSAFSSCALRNENVRAVQKPAQNISNVKTNESELERNRRLWRESKIVNYKMIVKLNVTGLYNPVSPVEITVKNGEAVSIKTFEKERRNVEVESYERFGNNTIEVMFEKIQSAENKKADKLEVKYDPKFGYPKEINIDVDAGAIDDESFVKVEEFEVTE